MTALRKPVLGLSVLLGWSAMLSAQPGGVPNRVLELEGNNSYVELPPDIFADLTEATVEAWVRWDDFSGQYKRIFDYGAALGDMTVGTTGSSNGLWFVVVDGRQRLHTISVWGVLPVGEWVHVAAVTGVEGMRIYLNGLLLGSDAYSGSFASLKRGGHFYLGQRVTSEDPPTQFDGAIDEFRVWNRARTAAEIKAAMFQRLTGSEPGLVGLWSFDHRDDGVVRDTTEHRQDGRLIEDAHIVEETLPSASELAMPPVLRAQVTNPQAVQARSVRVVVWGSEGEMAGFWPRKDGGFSLGLPPGWVGSRVNIQATSGNLGSWAMNRELTAGTITQLSLTLTDAWNIRGRVTSLSTNVPLAGIVVDLVSDTVETAVSDEDGEYQFPVPKPGAYRLRCHTPSGIREHSQVVRIPAYESETNQPLPSFDFQIAPFKKGVWRTFTHLDGLGGDHGLFIWSGA